MTRDIREVRGIQETRGIQEARGIPGAGEGDGDRAIRDHRLGTADGAGGGRSSA
jgi:hypothetical protein